ncbi:hypothetical protein Taro_001372 [Colocasia esculenta]|uniref:Uncharacterized protein n=1 Tax=Colocasia esculenta TaxID=4460 RepID=A0A843TKC2_COLES|nr:hypothetical protein [Colocasia esculenta]
MDANTNSGVQRYGRQLLWPACAAELQTSETRFEPKFGLSHFSLHLARGEIEERKTLEKPVRKTHFSTLKSDPLDLDPASPCCKEVAGPTRKASPTSPRRGDHPGARRKAIQRAFLQLLGTAQGVLDPPIHPRFRARVCVSAQTWFDGKVLGCPVYAWRPSTMPLTLSQRPETAVEFFWIEQ